MEILGKEINRTNDLRGKIYQNLKCLLQLSTNWTLNQSCPPSKWAWNNFWTNHINVPQHSMWFLLHICRKKWWRDIKMMTRAWVVISDKNHHDCSVPEVSPSKETVYTSETLTLCLKTGLCTLAGPCVWPIRNLGLFATFLSTWWKAFGWWILCSPQKSLYVVKKKKRFKRSPRVTQRLRRQNVAPPLMRYIWWLRHQISNSISQETTHILWDILFSCVYHETYHLMLYHSHIRLGSWLISTYMFLWHLWASVTRAQL